MGETVTQFCMELKDLSSTLSKVMDEETIEEENNHQYGHVVSSTYMYTSNTVYYVDYKYKRCMLTPGEHALPARNAQNGGIYTTAPGTVM